MRKYLTMLGIALLSILLVACGGSGGGSSDSSGGDGDSGDSGDSGDEYVVVVSWGGDYQAAQQESMFKPFEADTGIKIIEDHPVDIGKLKSMVENNNVEWDVVDALGADIPLMVSQGLLEPIDYSIVSKDDMLDTAVKEYAVDIDYYSTVLSYDESKFADGEEPKDWADFFDLEKYPGGRSLFKTPKTTLEIALMADGVAKEDLYPLDVDRAFNKLDEIKSEIIWWEEGAQPVQLLSDNQVALASAWNGRIAGAIDSGQTLAYTYQDGILDAESWVVPKGAKNIKAAMEFINYASKAKPQAGLIEKVQYGPTNEKAFEHLNEEFAKTLPTYEENLVKQVMLDAEWWNDHFDEINDRFQAWLLK